MSLEIVKKVAEAKEQVVELIDEMYATIQRLESEKISMELHCEVLESKLATAQKLFAVVSHQLQQQKIDVIDRILVVHDCANKNTIMKELLIADIKESNFTLLMADTSHITLSNKEEFDKVLSGQVGYIHLDEVYVYVKPK